MTSVLLEALEHATPAPPIKGGVTSTAVASVDYRSLLHTLSSMLLVRGEVQRPQISSTQPFAVNRLFGLDDILPSGAPLGQVVRLPRPPNPRRAYDGGFGEMLGSSEASGYLAVAMAVSASSHHGAGLFGGLGSLFGGGGSSKGSSGEQTMDAAREPAKATQQPSPLAGAQSMNGSPEQPLIPDVGRRDSMFSNEEYEGTDEYSNEEGGLYGDDEYDDYGDDDY